MTDATYPDLELKGDELERSKRLSDEIEPMLQGHGPIVQGAVLCSLQVVWALGWQDKELRKAMLELHFKCVREAVAEAANKVVP